MITIDTLLNMMNCYPSGECPYLKDRKENIRALRCPMLPNELHLGLIERGFRHSGDIFYTPECDNCKQCKSMRIKVEDFKPTKKQRHIFNKNKDITFQLTVPALSDEIYDIYKRYMEFQHSDSNQGHERSDLESFLYQPFPSAAQILYMLENRIVGVTIVDIIPYKALSSVYHFFDPIYARRSIGVFSVISEIYLCLCTGIPYYYLGYWVPGCKKMQYKANYQPNELLINGEWVRNPYLDTNDAISNDSI